MKNIYHVIIAGAGPAGCIMARDLSRAGIAVTVYERNTLTGLGHNWSDAVERVALEAVGIRVPPTGSVNTGPLVKNAGAKKGKGHHIFEEHSYPGLEVWAPDLSCKKDIEFRYITTDRKALARLLIEQAVKAGAAVHFKNEVTGLVTRGGGNTLGSVTVVGATVRRANSRSGKQVSADIVVDATGLHSVLRKMLPAETGISSPFGNKDLASVFRTVRIRRKNADDPIIDHYRYGYHTGYQWVQRLNDSEIDTGAGVGVDPKNPDPRDIVAEFISRHPSISDKEVRGGGGICLVGRSPYSLVAGGFIAVGDSAAQTIPMTGCGAGGAMVGAALAAETIITAAKEKRSDIASLWPYNFQWFAGSGRGANFAALIAMKNILQDLSHEEISFLFRRDIMSGPMLTDSINGIFTRADLATTIKTLIAGITRPALLMKLARATSVGNAIFKHYMGYPPRWNSGTFETWRTKAEAIFSKSL